MKHIVTYHSTHFLESRRETTRGEAFTQSITVAVLQGRMQIRNISYASLKRQISNLDVRAETRVADVTCTESERLTKTREGTVSRMLSKTIRAEP
jgi:hypothetical protein